MKEDLAGSRPPHGFTLIELMVSLAISLMATTAALSVLSVVVRAQREGIVRNELARDAQFALDVLSRDLHYLGAGVPRGFRADTDGKLTDTNVQGKMTSEAGSAAFGAEADHQLHPALRYGTDKALAFIGDLPYPNAELNGIASVGLIPSVELIPPGDPHHVHVMSELCPCGPEASTNGHGCDSTQVSAVVDLGGAKCTQGSLTQPTCPWGSGKWKNGTVDLIFTALDGSWYHRTWDGSDVEPYSGRALIGLNNDLPIPLFQSEGMGGGTIATLDRVFYSVENGDDAEDCSIEKPCTLYRKHCWAWPDGDGDPSDATFPKVGATAISQGGAPDTCDPDDSDGTPWEAVSGNITEFTFRYYSPENFNENLGTLTAEKSAKTRQVEVEFVVEKKVPGDTTGRTLKHRLRRRIWLENGGGLVTYPNRTPVANGGCLAPPPGVDNPYPNECNPQ